MHIVIVGGGAIGRLFGYYLARRKHRITIVDSDPEVVSALNSRGIEFMGVDQINPDIYSMVSVQAESDGRAIERCDLVLLTVKSSATREAAESVAHLINREVALLSLQTGLGNIEDLQELLPIERILAGFTYMTGTTLGHGKIRHGGLGTTYLGELDGSFSPRLKAINEMLLDSGIESRQVRRITGRLWSKVIVYAAINPLSALLRVSNGCLVEKEESRSLMKQLLDEGLEVAAACGIDLVYPDLWEELLKTCKLSSNNISPMLQDILNERPTEIGAQNGAICRYGREHGIVTLHHETMVKVVKLLEYWQPGTEMRC